MKLPTNLVTRGGASFRRRCLWWLLLATAGPWVQLSSEPADELPDISHGLLWQIDSPTGATSHLFGTVHVAEPAILQLPAAVQSAFDQSELLVVEVVLQADDYLEIAQRMKLTGGQRLPELIGNSLYSRVLHAAHGRDISQQMLRLRPWAAATLLFTPPDTDLLVLDQQLERDALAVGKPVIGLESLDEQLAVFEQMTLDDQIDLLHEAVLATLEFDVYYGELLVAYLGRDLAGLVQLSRLHLAQGPRLKKTLQKRLVDERNRRMITRLLPIIEQGGAFVAVGALHLPGEAGLLQGLHNRGYQISRRY